MRYALISDIHSNLEALDAVVESIAKEKIGAYLCIGDIVGYGADPKEAIRIVQYLRPEALIAGNHDWGTAGRMDLEYFNEYAQAAILWTRGVLNHGEIDFLRNLRLTYEGKDFTLAHGSLESPEKFHYIINKGEAYETATLMETPVCFVGHSHIAGIFHSDGGAMEKLDGNRVKLEPRGKYVINIGSVGQPRDWDPRASYAIYDTDDSTVEIKRVSYDIERARDKILKAGLPSYLGYRLMEGR